MNIQKKSSTKQNYFVSIRYLWGGRVKEENYKIPFIDKKLHLSVTQPKIVYPGQKSKIELQVTDNEGNPVEGVDLTAYSLTKKFGYAAPELPYLGKERKNKKVINHFSFKELNQNPNNSLSLNYDSWKALAGIDSIEYYNFIYPKNGIYQFQYNTSDSITQFSPFVVSNGSVIPVHVVYVDNKPVYFSWSTINQPYSFKIDSGYHKIKLRTTYREIVIDKLYFERGKKLIFSIDQDSENKMTKISCNSSILSDYEKKHLYPYIVPFRNNFGEQYAYFEQGESIQVLNSVQRYRTNYFAGPFLGNIKFQLIDSLSVAFTNESFFEYEFSSGLLKMRSVDYNRYPTDLRKYSGSSAMSDLVITKNAFEKQWDDYLDAKRYKTARYTYPNTTSKGYGRLAISYKRVTESIKDMPLNILVFRYDNHEFLRIYSGNTTQIHELKQGYYRLIFFYSGAKYHIEDSIFVKPNGLNYCKFEQPSSFEKDSFGLYVSNIIEETLFQPKPYLTNEEKELRKIYNLYQEQYKYTGVGDVIEGYVIDGTFDEPMIGANVIVEGTTWGTVTDFDGYYSIKVPQGYNKISFSYIGYNTEYRMLDNTGIINVTLLENTKELQEVVKIGYGVAKKEDVTSAITVVASESLIRGIPGVSGNISQRLEGKVAGVSISKRANGAKINIRGVGTTEFARNPLYIINGCVYTGDISELDASLIKNIEIIKDASATAIYGAQGANGVIIIETETGAFKTTPASLKGAEYDAAFLSTASQASSIRNNFSDYAFWQPSLTTNKEGKASFEVVFPDDVTSWETYYLAMNNKRQSGQTKGVIKSYKPLMAQLALPRFMVQGDTAFAIGKVVNYSPDSLEVETTLEIDGNEIFQKTEFCSNSLIDSLTIEAPNDSLSIKYQLKTADNYFDGEQRDLPVFARGIEETKGSFYSLEGDTTLQLHFDSTLGVVSLYARADILNVIEDEISHLMKYRYYCNEQIASKLKVLLGEKNIAAYKGVKFKNDKEVEKLIRLLKKNQEENGVWGWWKNSKQSVWISLHVLEALTHAEVLGYKTSVDKTKIAELLVWQLETSNSFNEKVRILKILNLLGESMNFQTYISDLEKTKDISLHELLGLMELKRLCGIAYDVDTLEYYKKTSLFGNVYYSDLNYKCNLLNNDVQNTLLAYKILKADSTVENEHLSKIRNYFFEMRRNGYWQNTYESAQIIEAILPDLLRNKSKISMPALKLSGDVNVTITEFPFEMHVNPDQQIEISKTGDFPVYFTAYQKYWNNEPTPKKRRF